MEPQLSDALVDAPGLREPRAPAGLFNQLMVAAGCLTARCCRPLRAGPEVAMHVPRGLPGSLPAGREEEGRRHRAGDLPGRVQSAGERFESACPPTCLVRSGLGAERPGCPTPTTPLWKPEVTPCEILRPAAQERHCPVPARPPEGASESSVD